LEVIDSVVVRAIFEKFALRVRVAYIYLLFAAALLKQSSMRKSDIGKLYSFKFPKRKDAILGIVLDFSEQWIAVRRLYDYSLDGYTIFRNDKVVYSHGEYERFASKILKKKNYAYLKEPRIPIDSMESLFSNIDKKIS
jgi:hypothetical protein